MAIEVPLVNQIVVFWLDPKLTLEAYGDGDDPELTKLVSDLPCKRYIGRVSKIITGILPNSVRPYSLQFVASKKSPVCPAVLIEEDMAFALEPNTQQDLPFPPVPTNPPLPWTDACLPVYMTCNIFCRPFESELTPTTMTYQDVNRMDTLAACFRERRRKLDYRPSPDESMESLEFDSNVNDDLDPQRRDNDAGSASSSQASSNSEIAELPLAVAAQKDPLGQLWWSMSSPYTDFSQRPAVQLSADLSLVPEIPADPFDFGREYQTLIRHIAAHKSRKIARAREQDTSEFKGMENKPPKRWSKLLSGNVLSSSKRQTVPTGSTPVEPASQRLSIHIRSRLSAVFSRRAQ